MIAFVKDLGTDNSLYVKVNILKKEIELLEETNIKPAKYIYGFPVIKSLFRYYVFPSTNLNHLKDALKVNLEIDLPLNLEEFEYSFVYRKLKDNKLEVFCVLAKKDDLKDFAKNSIVDSEIFALVRLVREKKLSTCEIIHFSKNYSYLLKIENGFPKEVRVLRNEDIKKVLTNKNLFVSGNIPDEFKSLIDEDKILSNPLLDLRDNILYGLILRFFDDFGIDLLHNENKNIFESYLKGAFYLFLSLLIVSLSLLGILYFKKKQLQIVKSKEKEIFIKYFDNSGKVYDPLLQAEGLVSSLKITNVFSKDAVDILNQIGRAKNLSNIKELYKIHIDTKGFFIEGKAKSIQDVEKFKNILSINFNTNIEETIKTPDNEVRFTIRGFLR